MSSKQAAEAPMSFYAIKLTRVNIKTAIRRFNELDARPGGRDQFTGAELVEYDLLGGLISDARAAIEAAAGAQQ